MLIPTCVLILMLITVICCFQLILVDCVSDETKLNNIQKINVSLAIIVLCYICLFIGKVVL